MTKKTVPIVLSDGKTRHLRFDFNALIALEETLGISIANLKDAMAGPGMLKAVRGILWAGLIHEDEALTLRAAGELIDAAKINEISAAVMDALSTAFGTAEGEPKNAETPVTPATETSPSTVPAS
jgi:hypothetical protein